MISVQVVSPLLYELLAGQRYAAGPQTWGEYFQTVTFDPAGHSVVRGEQEYYQIQFGHWVAFVKADDVSVLSSAVPAGTSLPGVA